MSTTTFLSNYTVGADAYGKIPLICGYGGRTAVVIGGKTAMEKVKNKLIEAVRGTCVEITDFIWFGGNATHKNIGVLLNNEAVKKADMIFAVGGGRAVDTAKAAADKLGKLVFTFPTIASNCAAVTSLCILYNEDGSFGEFYFGRHPAVHAFIDTEIIMAAPLKYLRAGIGDALSKQYEAEFNSRGDETDHENALGLQISRNCSSLLLKYGLQALRDADNGVISGALEQTALTIIINTGLVSLLVKNYYNSSMAHAVYIACTQLPECKLHMHGEIVAYGVLFLLTLDMQIQERNRVYAFNKEAGLPLCLADITIKYEVLDKFIADVAEDRYLEHAPYSISRQKIQKAIDELEQYHQSQS